MTRKIVIEPVTRIEGHAKVVIGVDDQDRIEQARFIVNEFRGFEKFCEGRMYFEMPQITQRICGICPVSHHLVSAKACDRILGVQPPRPARLLRELMHMGQIIQSHSMHFFELAGPDLLLGFDADPAVRNVLGVVGADKDLALCGIRLRRFGQEIIARLGERRIHPTFAVPGGVNAPLDPKAREAILAELDPMIACAQKGLAAVKAWMESHRKDLEEFAVFSTAYLGLTGPGGALALYDGQVTLVDARRRLVASFDGADYLHHIGEHVEPWSYLKFPYYKALGWPDGAYRVGPLGRLNAALRIDTPLAQQEYEAFHELAHPAVEGTLYYHYARLIENLYALERVRLLLEDPDILSGDIRQEGRVTCREGVGVLEAPRGTLWHHYWVSEHGQIQKVNLIVATGNNNYAMSRAVEEVARTYVDPAHVDQGALNRVEAAIRAYDPCLSCSTHALGRMPLELVFVDSAGRERRRISRGPGDSDERA